MAEEEGGPSFESTPSWTIGAIVFVIVAISLAVEKLLSYLGHLLTKKEKKPLYEALQKVKEELMLMGFVSLLLAFSQNKVAKICISEKLAQKWHPCNVEDNSNSTTTAHFQTSFSLLSNNGRRLLAENIPPSSCSEGKVPFISIGVLHDLHYFIFILAIVHAVTCTVTILLGEAKIRQWWKWEESIRMQNAVNGGDRNHQVIDVGSLDFIKNRFHNVDAHKRYYVMSFFKHLIGFVTKADYETMRLGFILTHFNGNQRLNFHKYIVYAYEADFEKVVSISWFLWLIVAISLSLNVAGWHIYFWISFIPLILLLIVGTKLEQVITEFAISIASKHTVIVGDVRIQPSDEYFWFNRPRIILVLIHIILFLNSFGFAVFFWTLFIFGFNSCVMGDSVYYAVPRILVMVLAQAICSYSTLPLYAIVTQMGSSYNEEAMERCGYGSSSGAFHRVPEGPNGSVEMANR